MKSSLLVLLLVLSAACNKSEKPSEETVKQSVEAIPPMVMDDTQMINCLDAEVQKSHQNICSSVIDPMKFSKGEVKKINCTGDLQDGYEANICENVNLKEQTEMNK